LFSRWRGQKKRKNLFSFFLSSNLPNSITHLEVSGHFNKSLDNLPNSTRQGEALTVGRACALITHLKFGYKFNKSVESRGKNKTLFCYFPDGEDRKKEKILFLSFYLLIYQRV